jgi:hypothetical protein
MKRLALALFIAITIVQVTITYAQDSLIGKYTGTVNPNPTTRVSVVIEILSVTGETVSGIGHRFDGRCEGEYPFKGRLKGNTLNIKHTKEGGRGGNCGFRFALTVEGSKLVGTMAGQYPTELSK